MTVYWITVVATIYMLGFFIPLLIQLFAEKGYVKNKRKFINLVKKYKFVRLLIITFKKKDINKSLSCACMTMGILSLILSNVSMLLFAYSIQSQLLSLFIGLWAPTLILFSLYLKK